MYAQSIFVKVLGNVGGHLGCTHFITISQKQFTNKVKHFREPNLHEVQINLYLKMYTLKQANSLTSSQREQSKRIHLAELKFDLIGGCMLYSALT